MQDDSERINQVCEGKSESTRTPARKPRKSAIARRIAFIAIVALICFSPVCHYAICKICKLDIGTSLTSKSEKSEIALSDIKSNPIAHLLGGSAADFANAWLSARLEACVPAHDELLLASAYAQRLGIRVADTATKYGVLPTFYGSSYAFLPEYQTIFELPSTQTEEEIEIANKTLSGYARLINENAGVNWTFYVADTYMTSLSTPAVPLMSGSTTYNEYYSQIKENLPGAATVIYAGYSDFDEFAVDRYRTDHHWNIQGAIKGYEVMANALGIEPAVNQESPVCTASYSDFYGSAARMGLDLDYADENIEDTVFDMSNLSVSIDGKSIDSSVLDYLNGTGSPYEASAMADEFMVYGKCFHDNYGEIVIENNIVDNGTLLIIADSFANPVDRFFAASYHRVVVIDCRTNSKTIQENIDYYEPDSILSIQTITEMLSGKQFKALGFS